MARRVSAVLALGCVFSVAAPAAPAAWLFVTEPFPPYTYAENGQPAGPLADVLREVCAQLKRECRLELMPWRRALSMAERGEAQGIFAFADAPERRERFHISAPVLDARYTFFTRAGDDFVYRDRQSLAGHTVGVYGPSGASILLTELTQGLGIETVLEADNPTVLRKMLAGRYGSKGLVLMNESVALNLMRGDGFGGLQSAGTAKSFSYSFGLTRQLVTAAQFRAFDTVLMNLCRSGRTAALVKPYALPASACKAR